MAQVTSEQDLKSIKGSIQDLKAALVEYGIPEALFFDYGDGNIGLYNNVRLSLTRKTGENERTFTKFPEGYLETIKQEVDDARASGQLKLYISSVVENYHSMIKYSQGRVIQSAEPDSVEERIAQYLQRHNITIIPESREIGKEALCFMQMKPLGEEVDLGEIVYDIRTGKTEPLPEDIAMKGYQLEGFVDQVRDPLVKLLREVNGDFDHERLEPIHEVLDKIESRMERY